MRGKSRNLKQYSQSMAMARTSIPNMVGVSPPTAEKVVPYGEGVAQVNIRII